MSLIDDTLADQLEASLADQLEASLAGLPAREPLDQRDTAKPERIPGDYKRNAKTGAPYVSDPSGDLVKSGDRKGMPKWTLYGRPSGFGKQIENTTNLEKWAQRRLVLGLAAAARGGEVERLLDRVLRAEQLGEDWEAVADGVVAQGLRLGKAHEAAEQGTHGHLLTEDAEDDDRDERSKLARLEAGEDLGLPTEAQHALMAAWRQLLTDHGLEVLATECKAVHDFYRQAGTIDRIVRLGRDLWFTVGDRHVVLAAGTVVVLDVKTGKLRRDKASGHPLYWQGYAVQIAAYAGGLPYDVDTETRGEWPWPIDQRWALLAHLPVAAALEGEVRGELILVDLERGNEAARLTMAAKDWENDDQTFGFMIAAAPAANEGGAPAVSDAAPAPTPTMAPDGLPAAPEFEVDAWDAARQADLLRRAQLLSSAERTTVLAAVAAQCLPSLKTGDRTTAELDAWQAVLDEVEANRPTPYTPPVGPAPTDLSTLVASWDDEGPDTDSATVAALQARYQALGPAKAWVNAIVLGSRQAGHELSLSASVGRPSVKRFETMRGLVTLAAAEASGCAEDSVVRALVAAVLGTDAAYHPSITVGQCVGVLGPDEARAFAVLAANLVDGDLPVIVEPGGVVRVVRR